MGEYDEQDLARDTHMNRCMALLAASFSGLKSGPAVLRRAKLYEAELNASLPPLTVYETEQCDREKTHRRHRWYNDFDQRVQCEGRPPTVPA